MQDVNPPPSTTRAGQSANMANACTMHWASAGLLMFVFGILMAAPGPAVSAEPSPAAKGGNYKVDKLRHKDKLKFRDTLRTKDKLKPGVVGKIRSTDKLKPEHVERIRQERSKRKFNRRRR